MKTKKESVLPSSMNNKSKKMGKKTRKISLVLTTLVSMIGCFLYSEACKQLTYNSLDISFKEIKEIEYGTANYNPLSLVEDSKGSITKYTKKVDTKKVGKQELVFEIAKNGISKKIKVNVEVKDTKAPTIALKEEEITITEGDSYDLNTNVEKVNDIVDGDLAYNEDEELPHYTISSDFDNNKPGTYTAYIKAVDSNGNSEEKSYQIKVEAKPVQKIVQKENYTNAKATVDTSSVVNAALSLIGTKYTYGGSSIETGFDCSGFVKYVYNTVGKNISRSSKSQIYDGMAVERQNMQAGDIIIWSTNSNNIPTHASIYIGDNTIVHAINSTRGVQTTNINYWENNGGGHIVSIRRI